MRRDRKIEGRQRMRREVWKDRYREDGEEEERGTWVGRERGKTGNEEGRNSKR